MSYHTYERNLRSPKFYDDADVGRMGYNPEITEYYTISGALIRVEEIFDGVMYARTISGSNFGPQWPTYSYKITYNAWDETTYSG